MTTLRDHQIRMLSPARSLRYIKISPGILRLHLPLAPFRPPSHQSSWERCPRSRIRPKAKRRSGRLFRAGLTQNSSGGSGQYLLDSKASETSSAYAPARRHGSALHIVQLDARSRLRVPRLRIGMPQPVQCVAYMHGRQTGGKSIGVLSSQVCTGHGVCIVLGRCPIQDRSTTLRSSADTLPLCKSD